MSHPEMTRRVTSSSRFAYDFPGFSTESPTCPSPPESWGSVTLAVYQGVTPGHDHHCPEASSGDIHPRGPKVTHTHVPLTGHPPLTSLHIWAALRSLQTQRHVFPGVKDPVSFLSFDKPHWFIFRHCRKFRNYRENVKRKI